jgi:hypothetical protein
VAKTLLSGPWTIRYGCRWLPALICCLPLLLASCGLRKPPRFTPGVDAARSVRDYADLLPGCRIRVVTPVLKSGGYMPQLTEAPKEGGAVVLKTNDDYVGYETSYYSVKGRTGGGVRISFMSAWVTEQGKTTRWPRPLVPLFELPDTARFIRLLYAIRVSQTDHDTAIVAASDPRLLENLTRRVRADPAGACRPDLIGVCKWVPNGIGVQIEDGH